MHHPHKNDPKATIVYSRGEYESRSLCVSRPQKIQKTPAVFAHITQCAQ